MANLTSPAWERDPVIPRTSGGHPWSLLMIAVWMSFSVPSTEARSAIITSLPLTPLGVSVDLDVSRGYGPVLIDEHGSGSSSASASGVFAYETITGQPVNGIAGTTVLIGEDDITLSANGTLGSSLVNAPKGSGADIPGYRAASILTVDFLTPDLGGGDPADITIHFHEDSAAWSFLDPFQGTEPISGASLTAALTLSSAVASGSELLGAPIELLPNEEAILTLPAGESIRLTAEWLLEGGPPYFRTIEDGRIRMIVSSFSAGYSMNVLGAIPEPGTGLLVACGLVGLAAWRRRAA
jgi:hypothetical protein